MKNNYRKLKWGMMLRTILVTLLALAVGFGILKLLIDGVFQPKFPELIISVLMRFHLSYEEANQLYGQIFMDNKDMFLAMGFIILFLIFFMQPSPR